jgi:hypothetical protein
MVRAVSRLLCHGLGSHSAAVPWLGRSVGGRAMAQAVICRPLTANACGICVEQSAKGVVFSLYSSTAGQYHSTMFYTYFEPNTVLIRRTSGRGLGTFRGSEEHSKVRVH